MATSIDVALARRLALALGHETAPAPTPAPAPPDPPRLAPPIADCRAPDAPRIDGADRPPMTPHPGIDGALSVSLARVDATVLERVDANAVEVEHDAAPWRAAGLGIGDQDSISGDDCRANDVCCRFATESARYWFRGQTKKAPTAVTGNRGLAYTRVC